jgi:hypothetical protein
VASVVDAVKMMQFGRFVYHAQHSTHAPDNGADSDITQLVVAVFLL